MIFSSRRQSFRFKTLTENFSMGLVIILLFSTVLEVTSVTTIGSKADLSPELSSDPSGNELCLIDESQKTYNVSDLLRCMNRLASNIRVQSIAKTLGLQRGNLQNQFSSGYGGRQYNNLEQSYFSGNPDFSNYQSITFPPRRQLGYYIPGSEYASAPSLSELQSSDGTASRFFKALSSISQYDDLKCVPRILCEATTGVMPGSAYKQVSSFQDLGNNALVGLLSAFDASESSPLITFAKAAILGYSSRGNPTPCFREYPKCPRNYDSLVHYLNNHKGGFFRFFGGLAGGYSPFSQTPYNQADSEISNSKIINGDLSLINEDPNSEEFKDKPFAREKNHSPKSSLVFPGDRDKSELQQIIFSNHELTENHASVDRMPKSLNSDFKFGLAYNNVNNPKRISFFPQEKRK